MAEPTAASDEVRAYLTPDVKPAMFGRELVEQLLAEHDAANQRAETAEAALDNAIALVVRTKTRTAEATARATAALEIELEGVNVALREAGIEYPLGARGVRDMANQRDGQQERAEEAEAERDQLRDANVLLRVDVANATPDHEALANDAIAAHEENDLLRVWLDELGYDALAVDARLRTAPDASTRAPGATQTAAQASGGHGEGSNSRASTTRQAGAARCTAPCDDDCETDCHETHQVPSYRFYHQPENCPARATGQEPQT